MTVIRTLVFAAVILSFTESAYANDYRDEIISHVVRPCFHQIAERNRVPGVTVERFTEMLIIMQRNEVDNMVNTVNNLLRSNPPFDQRQVIYRLSRATCIRGSGGG